MNIKLGDKVRDKISGLTGIAFARCEHLYGEDSIGVIGASVNNKPGEWTWFVEDRLEVLPSE